MELEYFGMAPSGVDLLWVIVFPGLQVLMGALLCLTSFWSMREGEDFSPPYYGLENLLSPGYEILAIVIWALHMLAYGCEVKVAWQAKKRKAKATTTTPIMRGKFMLVTFFFFAVLFCVHPLPGGVTETKFVEQGFGDPFRCIAAIILYNWWGTGTGDQIRSEIWFGLMIVSHDRLFYGPMALLVWAVTTIESLEKQDYKIKAAQGLCALIVGVSRIFLYKRTTSCLLIAATPLDAVFLSCLLLVHGGWSILTVMDSYCRMKQKPIEEITIATMGSKPAADTNPFKLL